MAGVQRINWVDWGKAFAIYLVVLGHLLSNNGIEGKIHDYIYLFHMPFFFFISGLLFKIKENNIREMGLRIWRSLIVPYIFLNVLSDIFLIPSWILGREWPVNNLVYFLTADGRGEPGPTWFLCCLAWVWLAFYYISKLVVQMAMGYCDSLWGCSVGLSLYIVLENRYCCNGVADLYGRILWQKAADMADGCVENRTGCHCTYNCNSWLFLFGWIRQCLHSLLG